MNKHYSITQTAKALGKSRPTVYKLIREGKLKVQHFGGNPVILATAVERVKAEWADKKKAA